MGCELGVGWAPRLGWAPRVGCPPGFWCTPMLTGTRGGGGGRAFRHAGEQDRSLRYCVGQGMDPGQVRGDAGQNGCPHKLPALLLARRSHAGMTGACGDRGATGSRRRALVRQGWFIRGPTFLIWFGWIYFWVLVT